MFRVRKATAELWEYSPAEKAKPASAVDNDDAGIPRVYEN
jgi:hypothetical protein